MKLWRTLRRRSEQLRWLLHRFRDLLRPERGAFALASVMLTGEILFQVLLPWPIKYITDGLLIPKEGNTLPLIPDGFPQREPWWFLGGVCGFLLLATIIARTFEFHRRVVAAGAGQRIVMKLRKRVYGHMQRLPMRFHDRSKMGDLLLRLSGDVPMLRDILSDSILEIAGRLAYALVLVGVMLWLDATLTVVAIAMMVVLLLLSSVFTKRVHKVVRKQRKKESALAYTAGETLRGVAQIKAYGQEEEAARRFGRQNRSSLRAGLKGTRLQASMTRWAEALFAFGTAVVMAIGVYRVLVPESLSAGDLMLFLSYIKTLNKPLRKLARMSTRIGRAAACGERLLEILDQEPEPLHTGERSLATAQGQLELRGVTLEYREGVPALRGVDLSIAAGERVALVGRNGAGKSSLMNVLFRFYEPAAGQVLLDGVDTSVYELASLRRQLTAVLQDSYLFGTSIADNLEFAVPGASPEQMTAVLRAVGAEFVERRPDGLDAALEEGGANLSGGERRKVLLAAGFLRDTPVLVLDEPTSNVDHGSRQDLVSRLPALTEGRTTLLVTHDADMLSWVDRVVFLDQGRVRDAGSHEELLARDREYGDLFRTTGGGAAEVIE